MRRVLYQKSLGNKLQRFYRRIKKDTKLYFRGNHHLTTRQKMRWQEIEIILLRITLILCLILALELGYIYYDLHHSIQIDDGEFLITGSTAMDCYFKSWGARVCCANRSFAITRYLDNSHPPYETSECYLFKVVK